MPWESDWVVCLRANEPNDPDAEDYEQVLMAVKDFYCLPTYIGEVSQAGNGDPRGPLDVQPEFTMVSKGYTVRHDGWDELQHTGYMWHLLRRVLVPPADRAVVQWNIWIMWARANGADPDSDPIPFARLLPDGTSDNNFFGNEVTFPVRVAPRETPRPAPKQEQGIIDLTVNLIGSLE